jgi:hypothetical protein
MSLMLIIIIEKGLNDLRISKINTGERCSPSTDVDYENKNRPGVGAYSLAGSSALALNSNIKRIDTASLKKNKTICIDNVCNPRQCKNIIHLIKKKKRFFF